MADEVRGKGYYALGGAVVLLELYRPHVLIVVTEVENVADLRPAEAVDALVVVSHHDQLRPVSDQAVQHFELAAVGILVLVDEYETISPVKVFSHLLVRLQQSVRPEYQVGEVHALVGLETLLVHPEMHPETRKLLFGHVELPALLVRKYTLVLEQGDPPAVLAYDLSAVVREQGGHQALAVAVIIDVE